MDIDSSFIHLCDVCWTISGKSSVLFMTCFFFLCRTLFDQSVLTEIWMLFKKF